MKNFGNTLFSALMATVLLLLSPTVWTEVSASVDRTQLSLGDSLTLSITATEGEDLDTIDPAALNRQFDVVGSTSSSSFSFINGKRSGKVQRILTLLPKREGDLRIPAFRIAGKSTEAIDISVGAPPAAGSADERVRVELGVDKQEVYVQEQILLTFKIILFENVRDSRVSELKIDNAFIKPLEQKNYRRRENGREALVYELRYAVFPQLSGTITVPAFSFSGIAGTGQRTVFGYGQRGQRIARATEPLTIKVKPRPANYKGADWLPTSKLSLKESWSKDPDTLRAGESITRSITISAEGLQGLQLPLPVFKSVDGISSFPDQDINTDTETPKGITGSRRQGTALVPQRAGTYTLPEVRISWWDITQNKPREAVLPARSITAAEGVNVPAVPPAAPQTPAVIASPPGDAEEATAAHNKNYFWHYTTALALLGWALTTVVLLRKRPIGSAPTSRKTPPSDKAQWSALHKACTANDALAARKALQTWLSSQPDDRPLSSDVRSAMTELDRALYGKDHNGIWRGETLLAACKKWRDQAARDKRESLSLYPEHGSFALQEKA
ncbi:MAG: hypothetical protein CSA53_03835 [Gammaproteobacteria bacterium]|nr:MAG: hypothetical protein CSA53_03835 [Gammaproteobacteria bacterium]